MCMLEFRNGQFDYVSIWDIILVGDRLVNQKRVIIENITRDLVFIS